MDFKIRSYSNSVKIFEIYHYLLFLEDMIFIFSGILSIEIFGLRNSVSMQIPW